MKNDVEIALEAKMDPIENVAKKISINEDNLINYGKYMAKISGEYIEKIKSNKEGKLILVTAINPTPAGEGKTTTNIGLSMALNKIGKKTITTLREPSLGPVFGIKGGAAGGGYSQVLPMENINLHFTGDFHAITSAHNLISAAIDNHIHHGNELRIDSRRITWKRVMDMNDRALRSTVVGMGGKANGFLREEGFDITVASEIMAILCLSEDLIDFKERVSKIIIGYSLEDNPIYVKDLKVEGAVALLMKDAIYPNLVQTIENTPAILHGGPFANIAHGCNSLIATKTALKLADYVVTEAGFGADLGAEKFLDIKCPIGGLNPSAVVIVATIRALKYHGGVELKDLQNENLDALENGFNNLKRHINNINKYKLPVVVAINNFPTDTEKEVEKLMELCNTLGVECEISKVWEKGSEGAIELAEAVVRACDGDKDFKPIYSADMSIKDKIKTIATEIYGAKDVSYSKESEKYIAQLEKLNLDKMPICMAKTQYSFSDDPKLLGSPEGFTLTVRDLTLSNGAGFIVVKTGEIMTMPGLPKVPAANNMDVDEKGNISGLF